MVERGAKGSRVTQLPKSARSERRVPVLEDGLWEDMRVHLAHHPRRYDPDTPVWPSEFRMLPVDLGAPGRAVYVNGNSFKKHAFLRVVAAAGLLAPPGKAVRFHDLRHTCGRRGYRTAT